MASISDLYSTGSTSVKRSLFAFILAPLLSALMTVAAVVLFMMLRIPPGGTQPGAGELAIGFVALVALGTLLVGAPLTCLGMGLIGLPTWLLLRFTNNESGVAYTLFGAVGGGLLAPALGGHKWAGFPMGLPGVLGGAIALFLFWRIARRRPI